MIKLGQKVNYIKRTKAGIERELGCNLKQSGPTMTLYRAYLHQSNECISEQRNNVSLQRECIETFENDMFRAL